jgi:hypothetical protein
MNFRWRQARGRLIHPGLPSWIEYRPKLEQWDVLTLGGPFPRRLLRTPDFFAAIGRMLKP